jgi:hypothetical protein
VLPQDVGCLVLHLFLVPLHIALWLTPRHGNFLSDPLLCSSYKTPYSTAQAVGELSSLYDSGSLL